MKIQPHFVNGSSGLIGTFKCDEGSSAKCKSHTLGVTLEMCLKRCHALLVLLDADGQDRAEALKGLREQLGRQFVAPDE